MMNSKKLPADCHDMTALRAEIDRLDRALMELLAERVTYIDRAAQIKSGNGLPARIDDRVEEVAMNARRNATEQGFDPDLAEDMWRKMIDWSIAREEQSLKGHQNDS